ncbi:MAG: hypothetical protein ACE5DM_05720, partial [Candidatus Nanoarchaeia archaeon]
MDDFTHAAEQGLCEVLYPDDDPKLKEVQDACTACGESVNTYWKTRWAHRFLCDRVICPSVPTFQHYVQQKGGGRSRLGVALNLKTSDKYKSISSIANFIEPTDVNQGQGVTSEKGPNIPNQLDIKHDCQLVEQRGAREIKKLYTAYNQNKDELKDECSGPHPYQPQCCAAAYMNDWNWGAVFIDPLKQSMCLANPSDDECGLGARVVNGIVGICEPNNKQSRLQTAENMRYTPEFTRAMPTEPEGHVVYLIEYDSDGKLTRVVRGYIKRQYDLQPGEATVGKEFVPVVSNQGFMEDSPNLADAFDKINPADPDSEEPADDKAYQIFAQDLKQNSLGGEREIIIKNPYARRKYSSTPSTAAGTSSGGAALPGAGTSGTTGGTSGGGTASSGTTVPGATGKTVAKITGAAGEKDGKTDEKDAKAGDAKADSKGAKAGDAKANDKGAKAGDAKANDKKSEKANGNDFGDYASGLKGDKCPSERKIPNYARTKYGGKECCADKMIWKQSLGACKFVCPPEQQRQDDRTLCCPNGQVWSRDKNGCTASTYGHEFGKGDIPKYKLKDEDIRAAYYRISGEVGTVSQTYVLKPSSSFTQALIALCLTAIRRYLIQILRIMKQLKMCFESILYT